MSSWLPPVRLEIVHGTYLGRGGEQGQKFEVIPNEAEATEAPLPPLRPRPSPLHSPSLPHSMRLGPISWCFQKRNESL